MPRGLGKIARDDDRCVIVHIDEVQNVAADRDALSALLIALGDALVATIDEVDRAGNLHTRYLPIVVYLSGLPSLLDQATRSDVDKAGATFARRFKPVHLSWLSDADVRVALTPFTQDGWPIAEGQGVTATADAVEAIIDRVSGDPFLLQLIGASAWDARPGSLVITLDDVTAGIAAIRDEETAHVRRIIDRLPELEAQLLRALISLPPAGRTLTAAATRLGRPATQLGTTSRRLEERVLIQRGRPIVVTAQHVERLIREDDQR